MECLRAKDFVMRVHCMDNRQEEPRLVVLLIALPLSFIVAIQDLQSAWPVVPSFPVNSYEPPALSAPSPSGSPTSSTARPGPLGELSRIYRSAASSFLTRRYDVAFSSLEPAVSPSSESNVRSAAAIHMAPKSLRVKLWCLYTTLVHVIIVKHLRDGQHFIGGEEWMTLLRKVQQGTIWDEVVMVGYLGAKEDVDLEVVINLAALSLNHGTPASLLLSHVGPYWDALARHLSEREDSGKWASLFDTDMENDKSNSSSPSDHFEPGEISCIHILLEIYALHLLPKCGQWKKATDVISTADILDPDTRANFLKALQSFEEAEKKPKMGASPMESERQSPAYRAGSEESEVLSVLEIGEVPHPRAAIEKKILKARRLVRQSRKSGKDKASASPMTLGLMHAFRNSVESVVLHIASLGMNKVQLLRALLFLFGILVALSKAKMREGLGKVTAAGWKKVKGTVAMGVKVSYP